MSPTHTAHLRADCSNCFALCCTAFGFSRSIDFAEDKPAGTPCRNLASSFDCTIHDGLRARGFRGCTVFDCFGAGQAVSQRLFGGVSWRDRPGTRHQMFSAFSMMKQLHEMLWYLSEAQNRTYDPAGVRALASTVSALTFGTVSELLSVEMGDLHGAVRDVLMSVSEEVRASYAAEGGAVDPRLFPGADLAGLDLRGNRLCGADLRGTCLIAVDLRGVDLAAVDLLGADLRDARLDGSDLSGALYLTQPQINAARGSATTVLPAALVASAHW